MNFFSSRASINQRYCILEISFGDACLASSFIVIGYLLYCCRSCVVDDRKHVEREEKRKRLLDDNVAPTIDKNTTQ